MWNFPISSNSWCKKNSTVSHLKCLWFLHHCPMLPESLIFLRCSSWSEHWLWREAARCGALVGGLRCSAPIVSRRRCWGRSGPAARSAEPRAPRTWTVTVNGWKKVMQERKIWKKWYNYEEDTFSLSPTDYRAHFSKTQGSRQVWNEEEWMVCRRRVL